MGKPGTGKSFQHIEMIKEMDPAGYGVVGFTNNCVAQIRSKLIRHNKKAAASCSTFHALFTKVKSQLRKAQTLGKYTISNE